MADNKPTILILGALDAKLPETLLLRDLILALANDSCQTKILDTSRSGKSASEHASAGGTGVDTGALQEEIHTPLLEIASELKSADRSDYIDKAVEVCIPAVQKMVKNGEIHGIVSAGGSTELVYATAVMRQACPIGFPKLMVSTTASGDIGHYIQDTDITIMHSVVGIAGVNSILTQTLSNAAGAIVGMTSAYVQQQNKAKDLQGTKRKRIAISMSQFTDPCVRMIRAMLAAPPHDVPGHEIYLIDTTGTGGRAMERLIDEGQIDAVIDLTLTEIPDELFGGIMPAGPHRLKAAAMKGIPTVVSVGGCDSVTFGPKNTVPTKFAERKFDVHSPAVTLVRTSAEENEKIGEFISSQLKTHTSDTSRVRVLLPQGGVSTIDIPNEPFHDPEADAVLFSSIKAGLDGSKIEVFEFPEDINSEKFAKGLCEHLLEIAGVDPRSYRLANARRRQWSFDHGKSISALRRASLISIPDAE